jgi:hypothetical protein
VTDDVKKARARRQHRLFEAGRDYAAAHSDAGTAADLEAKLLEAWIQVAGRLGMLSGGLPTELERQARAAWVKARDERERADAALRAAGGVLDQVLRELDMLGGASA